jgi:hypothetical protein
MRVSKSSGKNEQKNKLSEMVYSHRKFDPKNKKDIEEYSYFVVNNRWKDGCPFHLEWPHLSVPDMIKDKIIRSVLGI